VARVGGVDEIGEASEGVAPGVLESLRVMAE
jgi:hypothetical protein